jgi:hypothetical protein
MLQQPKTVLDSGVDVVKACKSPTFLSQDLVKSGEKAFVVNPKSGKIVEFQHGMLYQLDLLAMTPDGGNICLLADLLYEGLVAHKWLFCSKKQNLWGLCSRTEAYRMVSQKDLFKVFTAEEMNAARHRHGEEDVRLWRMSGRNLNETLSAEMARFFLINAPADTIIEEGVFPHSRWIRLGNMGFASKSDVASQAIAMSLIEKDKTRLQFLDKMIQFALTK